MRCPETCVACRSLLLTPCFDRFRHGLIVNNAGFVSVIMREFSRGDIPVLNRDIWYLSHNVRINNKHCSNCVFITFHVAFRRSSTSDTHTHAHV